jgi:hypothetical protein
MLSLSSSSLIYGVGDGFWHEWSVHLLDLQLSLICYLNEDTHTAHYTQ